MQRYKLTISYDGNYFDGFQIQKHTKKTVAGQIQKALEKIQIYSKVVGSGRTDKGVHSLAQVIHIDIPYYWQDSSKLCISLNKILHPHIHIRSAQAVKSDFHARFDAKARLYRYILYHGTYNPIFSAYANHFSTIDITELNSILQHFIGTHNFVNFKKIGSDTKSDIRTIYKAGAYQYKQMTIIYFKGNSFLRSQVRMMIAFALDIMENKKSLQDLDEQLHNHAIHSKKLAPASGLYLAKIYY